MVRHYGKVGAVQVLAVHLDPTIDGEGFALHLAVIPLGGNEAAALVVNRFPSGVVSL